jgi:hypothetical protein
VHAKLVAEAKVEVQDLPVFYRAAGEEEEEETN